MTQETQESQTPKRSEEEEIESVGENEDEEQLPGFDFESDFDPMQALGQLLVTPDGETIPDVLVGIRSALITLTKVLHKVSKTLEKK
jgi:hypothetical protein